MRSVRPPEKRRKGNPSPAMKRRDDWRSRLRSTVLSGAQKRGHVKVRMPEFRLPPMPEEFNDDGNA